MLLVCLVGAICCGVSGDEGFFHSTKVRSVCLSLSQASRSFGKATVAQRERVATEDRYPLSVGQLAHAALFFPFSIQSMYSSTLRASSHHVGMARRIFTASVS